MLQTVAELLMDTFDQPQHSEKYHNDIQPHREKFLQFLFNVMPFYVGRIA